MAGASSHEDLIVWQRAMEVVEQIYAEARRFPAEERFGLTSQITRAAVSVPANIAEGHGRNGRREYAKFVSIAAGSLAELQTLVEVAARLGYCDRNGIKPLRGQIDEVGRMLNVLGSRLRSDISP